MEQDALDLPGAVGALDEVASHGDASELDVDGLVEFVSEGDQVAHGGGDGGGGERGHRNGNGERGSSQRP